MTARINLPERKRINRAICPVADGRIGVGEGVSSVVRLLRERGVEPEDFLLCGVEGRANVDLFRDGARVENTVLHVTWHERRLEVAYLT